MTDKAFWEEKYHNNETGWDRGSASPALLDWLKALKPCRILVPGCGRGHEVIELARRGFDVTAVDIATPAIDHMQAMLEKEKLTATLIHGDLFEIELPPMRFMSRPASVRFSPPNGKNTKRGYTATSSRQASYSACSCRQAAKAALPSTATLLR